MRRSSKRHTHEITIELKAKAMIPLDVDDTSRTFSTDVHIQPIRCLQARFEKARRLLRLGRRGGTLRAVGGTDPLRDTSS
jgi:hypothetical protein